MYLFGITTGHKILKEPVEGFLVFMPDSGKVIFPDMIANRFLIRFFYLV